MIQQERDKVAAQILNYVWLYIFIYIYIYIEHTAGYYRHAQHSPYEVADSETIIHQKLRKEFVWPEAEQVFQASPPSIYAGQFFQSSLPSMSPEQVFQASLPSKGLGGRLARKTCLKDVLGVIGRLAWCVWKTCLEVFQASLPTKHRGAVHRKSRRAVRSRGIYIYIYIYIYLFICC